MPNVRLSKPSAERIITPIAKNSDPRYAVLHENFKRGKTEVSSGLAQWDAAQGLECHSSCEELRLNQGQVSRICAGKFVNFSSNVMQICIIIGLEPSKYLAERALLEERARIAESAIQIWDGTREDAERIVSLFREIAAFRSDRR